jgi:hypothetical protein
VDLVKFLIKARRATYAIPDGESSEDGGEQLTYMAGSMAYRDRYFGMNPYGGQELVWNVGHVVWMMNYYAEVTSDDIPLSDIYEFQRLVMGNPVEEKPMRGASGFRQGDFEYRNTSEGNLEGFTGREVILHRGKEVYWMVYHGGIVGDRALSSG